MALGRDTESRYDRRAVGVFPTRVAAEKALHELKNSGFNMDRVSVVTKDGDGAGKIEGATVRDEGTTARDKTGNKADEGAEIGAVSGGTLGGLTGLLVGLGTLAIPGVGPIMLAGATATALATTVAGGTIGAATGGLLGGLAGLGIPEKEAKHYNDRVHSGDYLMIVDGSESEILRAETLLKHQGIRDWSVNTIPADEMNRAAVVEQPVTGVAPTPARMVPDQSVRAGSDDTIKLYEERLVVDKDREKTGEVAIGKHIETETARVSIPIEKERVVIERVTGNTEAVVSGDVAFGDTETIRMEVYEETPDIHKEAFVREEVTIRKEVSQETVTAQETLRREELEVNTDGHPVVNADRPVNDRL